MLIDPLLSHEENWVISIENSEPLSQDDTIDPSFISRDDITWTAGIWSGTIAQLQINWQQLLLLFDRQNTSNKFRTHSSHVQICC